MEPPEEVMALEAFALKKNRPGCTGMFWRGDPREPGSHAPGDNWPRDGAELKGEVHEHNGGKWLECKAVKQKGKSWVTVKEGCWMPFEYQQYYLEAVK